MRGPAMFRMSDTVRASRWMIERILCQIYYWNPVMIVLKASWTAVLFAFWIGDFDRSTVVLHWAMHMHFELIVSLKLGVLVAGVDGSVEGGFERCLDGFMLGEQLLRK